MQLTGDPRWHVNAVIYSLHVKTFCDGNGDGIGDFLGLTRKLDYIESLGVTCVWLLPFYPSPLRDDGYDVAHYERVDPRYGSLDDFRRFVAAAHERSIRVIADLVVNHTSDQHPWFQAARRAPAGSPKREFYVWGDTTERYPEARVIFHDVEASNWTWDPVARQYYWHRFFHHQPDLNFDNPRVRRAVLKVVRFWLDHGVDGLRLDAIAHLYERDGTTCDNLPETHRFLKDVREVVAREYPDRILLAEVNQSIADTLEYFGTGDECHMAFHFPLMPRLFLALELEDPSGIVDVVKKTADLPHGCQWATFLRNHDELTLSALSGNDRAALFRAYARAPRARLNHGIRRRLAPLLGNDQRRIELANALLLSLPGSPVLYYGDEIGMGDALELADRDGLRLPMAWSDAAAQERDPGSLLSMIRRLIGVRRRHAAFAIGSIGFLESGNPRVLAFVRRRGAEAILVVSNLSSSAERAAIELPIASRVELLDLIRGEMLPPVEADAYPLHLAPHAFSWIQLRG